MLTKPKKSLGQNFLVDKNIIISCTNNLNEKDNKTIREFSNELINKTLELDGTVTGEHGIGINKKEYLIKQHKDNIPLMQLIKRNIDPNNIMNPGKIFDIN